MKKAVCQFIVVCVIVLVLGLSGKSQAGESERLPVLDMAELTSVLDRHAGKVIVLNFFATWCPPCRAEIPELASLHEKLSGNGLVIIGLSVDNDQEKVPPFVKKMAIPYQVFGTGPDIHRAFRLSTIPVNVVYDRNGKKVAHEVGLPEPDGFARAIKSLLEGKNE